MTAYIHRFFCVPAANQAVARELCKRIADTVSAGSADAMFTTEASATGTGLATHYLSSGMIDANFASLLGNAAATFGAYQQSGGTTVTLAQVQALYAAAPLGTFIRSDAQGKEQSCLAALGLKLIAGTA